MTKNTKDGLLIGLLLGIALTTPQLVVWTTDFLNSIIPTAWFIFGSYSLSIFGAIAGALIGLLVDKT